MPVLTSNTLSPDVDFRLREAEKRGPVPPTPEQQKTIDAKRERAEKDTTPRNLDLSGMEVYSGDTVQLDAVVKDAKAGKLTLVFERNGPDKQDSLTIDASRVKRTTSTRISAAPKLRTPVVELPDPLGGVLPVSADQLASGEITKENPRVQEIPNASPAAQEVERKTNPVVPTPKQP